MVLGFILTMVTLLPNGDIEGKTLDYFKSNIVCYTVAVEMEAEADPGVGFVCLEDYVDVQK